MDPIDYQAKLKALGIDRGKLDTGFVEHESEPAAENSNESAGPEPVTDNSWKQTKSPKPPKPVSYCISCGVATSRSSKRCRACFRKEMSKTWKSAEQGVSLPPQPSPPTPQQSPLSANRKEEVVHWNLLTEEEILTIAKAVIKGHGGMAHIDDIEATVVEMTKSRLGSMLCTLVLRGDIDIGYQGGEVLYAGPGCLWVDWDYVI